MLTYKQRVKIALFKKGITMKKMVEETNVSLPTILTVLNKKSLENKSHASEMVKEYIEKKLGIKS